MEFNEEDLQDPSVILIINQKILIFKLFSLIFSLNKVDWAQIQMFQKLLNSEYILFRMIYVNLIFLKGFENE